MAILHPIRQRRIRKVDKLVIARAEEIVVPSIISFVDEGDEGNLYSPIGKTPPRVSPRWFRKAIGEAAQNIIEKQHPKYAGMVALNPNLSADASIEHVPTGINNRDWVWQEPADGAVLVFSPLEQTVHVSDRELV